MATYQQLAQLLISSWKLAEPRCNRVPVSHGLLDKALQSAADDALLPDWASRSLHFANTRVGLRCVELPDILEWAQLAELTSSPNPTYRYAEIQLDEDTARKILSWLNVDEATAESLGRRIQQVIDTESTPRTAELSAAAV
jgi:hypothetical protein